MISKPDHVPPVAWRACASPIEKAMLIGMLGTKPGATVGMAGTDIVPQVTVSGARADFVVRGVVVVECDGVEYHRRPEAMKRDRELDRARAEEGYVTLRYSGDEIWASPAQCAQQVWRVVHAWRRA